VRPRTLAVLAVVVGALLAFIYFAEDRVASTDERAAAAKRLVDAEPEEVEALDLQWQGQRIRFERAAKTGAVGERAEAPGEGPAAAPSARPWRIVEPFVQAADDAAVDRLLTTFTGLEAARDLAGAARQDVGLEPPRGSVSWRTGDGEGTLEIGGAVPASRDVVVAVRGREALAVASDSFLADLSRPPGDWRSRAVVTAARDRIERVTVSDAGAEPIVLVRSGETLRLESPVADLVDRELADRLLADLAALRMENFLDPPLPAAAEGALADLAARIEIGVAGEPDSQRIEVGAVTAAGKRIWRAGGQVFESSSNLAATVARPAGEWRSRTWTRFENWRIEKARFEDAAGAFELARSDGEWLRDGKGIPFAAASDLLAALTAARAERLVELPAASAGATAPVAPRLTVTLSDADGNEELLTLYDSRDPDATMVPARARGREVELLLPRDLVTALESKVAAVRQAATSPPGS
jgi:hypothetical protein